MKKFWKKPISLMLIAATLLSFSACAGKSSDKGSPSNNGQNDVTLNVWHEWVTANDPQTVAFNKAIKDYESSHKNVKIQLHGLEDSSYKTKIATEFAGSAKNVDVFFYWAPGRLQKLLKADKILPIDSYVSDSVKSEIKKGTTASFESDGKLYALPMNSFMMLLFCNKSIFKQAGATVPTTYNELLDASAKISKLNGVVPLALGAKDGWLAGALYEALALDNVGAQKINDVLLGKEAFNDPGFRTAATQVVELYKKGVLGKNPLEDGSAEADSKFLNGKAAMRFTGSWFCGGIDSDSGTVKNNVEIVKFPVTDKTTNKSDYSGGSNSSFFVNKDTANPKEAADLAIYLSRTLGKQALEIGAGYSTWTDGESSSKVGNTFKTTLDLFNKSENGVLTWDTLLDDNSASVHLEEAQALLSPNANADSFVSMNQKYIGKK